MIGRPSTRSSGSVVGWPAMSSASLVKPGMSPPTETRSAIEPVPDSCGTRSAKSWCNTSADRFGVVNDPLDLAPESAGLRAMDANPPSWAASCQHSMSTSLGRA